MHGTNRKVFIVVTKEFLKGINAVAMDYLKNRAWTNQQIGKVLSWMADEQGTNEDAAIHFIETYPEIWQSWVSPEVAAKIKG
ncbi:MAG: glycine betaine ABC transporter substrate-binding protein [Ahrensia sp.]|nr:glycine betaine ABC transporter substrate-binding protein [Ahrensia sp.]